MPATVTSNGAKRATPSLPPPGNLASTFGAQRNRSRVAAGGLLLAICTLAAIVVYGRVGDRQAVLAMARTVDVGEVVEAKDLRVVQVSSDAGVRSVPATDRTRIVGHPAAVRLVAGSLLSPAEIGEGAGLADGMALIGTVLKAGQFPLSLAPGDTVALVTSAASGSDPIVTSEATAAPPTATVVAVETGVDATGNTAVTLQLPTETAAMVAGAGAGGRLNLIVVDR